MQSWMLGHLACPTCRGGRLEIERRDEVATLDAGGGSEEILVTGILICGHCDSRYPVMEEAPRLLRRDMLTREEEDVLLRRWAQTTSSGSAQQLTDDELDAMLREAILHNYGHPCGGPTLRRALSDLEYQRSYADRRVYQMEILRDLISRTPRLILDVGGGNGGNLRAASRVFPLQRGIVADLSPSQAPFFQTGDRRLAYVRADATRLPFKSESFDLVISSFLIEHVSAWTEVVDELTRVGRTAFIAFGPNIRFPFEIGHVDAPLAHCLPTPLGTFAAYLWGHLRNNRRTYRSISAILRDMNYISSSRYYAYCRRKGHSCTNLFPAVMQARTGSLRSGARDRKGRYPRLARLLAWSLVAMGAEPNIYSLITSTPDRRPAASQDI